jgi:hypothetical protein
MDKRMDNETSGVDPCDLKMNLVDDKGQPVIDQEGQRKIWIESKRSYRQQM